jgi:hypothetical protein
MLKRLARYALNDYFIFGPETWREREDREVGFTVQEENDLPLLYHDGNLRLLSFYTKKPSLDRRPRDPSMQGRWHPSFHLEMEALRPPVVALTYGFWSRRGPGLSPRLPTSLTLSMEVSFLSALVACPESGAPSDGDSLSTVIRYWWFFILISLFS